MMTFKLMNSSLGESRFEKKKHADGMSWGGGQGVGLPGRRGREGLPDPWGLCTPAPTPTWLQTRAQGIGKKQVGGLGFEDERETPA